MVKLRILILTLIFFNPNSGFQNLNSDFPLDCNLNVTSAGNEEVEPTVFTTNVVDIVNMIADISLPVSEYEQMFKF